MVAASPRFSSMLFGFGGVLAAQSADWLVDRSEAAATDLLVADPSLTTTPGNAFNVVTFNNNVNIPRFGIPWDQRFLTASRYQNYSSFYDPVNGRDVPAVSRVDSYGGALTLDWKLSDDIAFKSITAYRGYSGDFSDDQDASPLNLAYVYNVIDHHQFSQEIQFTGTAFDSLRFGGGGAASDFWGQVMADVIGVTVSRLSDPSMTNARGAAFLALERLGRITLDDIPSLLRVERVHEPDPSTRAMYQRLKERFVEFHSLARPFYAATNHNRL